MNGSKCKSCGFVGVRDFLSLGNIPPVNSFIYPEQIKDEKSHPLNLAYCPICYLVQLKEIVPPEELFRNYLHLSAASASNVKHLEEVANYLSEKFNVNAESKVLEIGSNDGTLLEFFKKNTSNVLGVDPAKNLVDVNKERGVAYIPEFFDTSSASEILKTKGKQDLIIALNVIPHTPNNIDSLKAARILLKDKGIFVMEGVYALETILRGEFDTIYHEHVYTFSLHSLINTFRLAGLKVFDVEKIPTQGGSLRVFAMKEEFSKPASENVKNILQEESASGLADQSKYDSVSTKVEKYKEELKKIVEEETKRKKIIGLGAPARGVVILNYCGIGKDKLEYIIDDTHLKQGKVMPGVHIPIKSWSALDESYRDRTFFLLSWNYKEHMLSKLKSYSTKARVIVPFPKLEVVELG